MDGRLGVYSDDVFRLERTADGPRISSDQAFLLFTCAVGQHFDRLVLFGRTLRADRPADHVLPPGTELVALPYYASLRRLGALARAAAGTATGMWRGLARVDVVWVLGPNPFAMLLIALALLRRRRVVLGVRQDTPAYFRSRLPGRRWAPALVPVWALDRSYRLLARWLPTTVVGTELARGYGSRRSRSGARPRLRPRLRLWLRLRRWEQRRWAGFPGHGFPGHGFPGHGGRRRAAVLPMTVTLVPARDVATAVPQRDWTGPLELLAVGRVDREKNPLLLVDALAHLERQRPGRHVLRLLGRGPLEDAVRRHARRLGVDGRVVFGGYVPFGPALLRFYRQAHILVHVSLTEGVPQVLMEGLACGTPVVATDVGGVRAALDGGRAGLLVPPSDVGELVAAINRLVDDAGLRDRLVAHGLDTARAVTLEAEAGRVARFIAGGRPGPGGSRHPHLA
ncbi:MULTISPECIES: glycosyltransferase [unclassified Frankia]|uniref:glycosyltransferase n=1 Tax=unclassified Frankia TaxID=2632575 RepID=UPI0020251F42